MRPEERDRVSEAILCSVEGFPVRDFDGPLRADLKKRSTAHRITWSSRKSDRGEIHLIEDRMNTASARRDVYRPFLLILPFPIPLFLPV
jgi:hypothetical protein